MVAGREVARELLGDRGHKYLIGIHEEGGKAHVHIIVNNYNKNGGPKLRLNNPELFEMRSLLAEKLTEMGLEHVATFRKDRPATIERVAKGIEDIKNRQSRYVKTLEKSSPSFSVFQHKKVVAKTIYHLRKDINSDHSIPHKDKVELKEVLRNLETNLATSDVDIAKEVKATLKHFEKQTTKLRLQAQQLSNPDLTQKEKDSREKSLQFYKKSFENVYQINKEAIESSSLPDLEKKARLELLNTHKVSIDKAFNKSKQKEVINKMSPAARVYSIIDRLEARNKYFHRNAIYDRKIMDRDDYSKATEIAFNRLEKSIAGDNKEELKSIINHSKIKIATENELWATLGKVHKTDREYRNQWLQKEKGRVNQDQTIGEYSTKAQEKILGLKGEFEQNKELLGGGKEDDFYKISDRLLATIDSRLGIISRLDKLEKDHGNTFYKELNGKEKLDTKFEELKNITTKGKLSYPDKKAIYGEIHKAK